MKKICRLLHYLVKLVAILQPFLLEDVSFCLVAVFVFPTALIWWFQQHRKEKSAVLIQNTKRQEKNKINIIKITNTLNKIDLTRWPIFLRVVLRIFLD
jgi:hypothetical protein